MQKVFTPRFISSRRQFLGKAGGRRASEIKTAGTWNAASAVDRVVLDAAERHRGEDHDH